MRVALDATYSVDSQPSGIAVYSRHILNGLAETHPQDHFTHCYRPKQFRRAPNSTLPNVSTKMLLPFGPGVRADVFHALNQRVDRRPAEKVVSTFHDLFVITGEYSSPDFRERFARQAQQAAESSDLLIAVSAFTAHQISSCLKIEPSRIRVIPHGVIPPRETPPEQREPIILFVGALQLRKNVKRLVEAFESVPPPWRLVLAGAPTGYRAEEIIERIAASPSRQRIEVTGYVTQAHLENLFSRASIFAFPSLDEGFGIPVLEAMAWHVPVLTANSSALAELGAGAALLVDPLSVDEIAGALHRLIDSEDLRKELIRSGAVKASGFTWADAIRKTYEVYQELG